MRTINPVYNAWAHMKSRCLNTRDQDYVIYGDRGIMICSGLMNFETFVQVVGLRPDGYTLDREASDGHYSCGECEQCRENGWPKNVRWVTTRIQAINRRPLPHQTNLDIIYRGVSRTRGQRRFKAFIVDGRCQINLGRHDTQREAAIAYNRAALRLRGREAKLNRIRIETVAAG